MKRPLKAALICGLTPLTVGLGIFGLWMLTRWQWLMFAGEITILAGLGFLAVGASFLAAHVRQARRSNEVSRRRLIGHTFWATSLLLINFPAAMAVMFAVVAIQSRYVVSVTNKSDIPLTSARVFGGGITIEFPTIPPGATVRRATWIKTDGSLVLTGVLGPRKIEDTIDGYVTGNLGGNESITIKPDGSIEVEDVRTQKQRER